MTAAEIFAFLCELAPLELQMSFDNAGFLVGHTNARVTKVLTALDITEAVIDEAVSSGAELIVSHHPVIFTPVRRLSDDDVTGNKLLQLAENHIAAICMHTNLDIADDGVNDILINILGADKCDILDADGCGRIGLMRNEMAFDEFLIFCRDTLKASGLRYYNSGKPVCKLAVMGGAGAGAILDAYKKGCDTYVTSDIKYHDFQLAESLGINLIDAGHFCTEDRVIDYITDALKHRFTNIAVEKSRVHHDLIQFI